MGNFRNILRGYSQRGLLLIAALFLVSYAIAFSLSPVVLLRNTSAEYLWDHWIALGGWVTAVIILHHQIRKYLPDADQLLFPIAALITGWGTLTIWRLTPTFGLRQTVWLLVASGIFIAGLKLNPNLNLLRRYKYIWLTAGLGLTGLTFLFGTNPLGIGPRLWLGCCGLYLQPSEPLKLLLIIFLAAYLADRQPLTKKLGPLYAPTGVMLVITLLMLFTQRDLGTAFIFVLIYSVIIFVATGQRRILGIAAIVLIIAGIVGYMVFDVVQLRVEAWLNPWLDPSGRSYQIVQSLMALASGGMFGRGPGLGNPEMVPISLSDFIFSSMVEETGLVGGLGLLLLIGLFFVRSMRIALHSDELFHRYLATGLAAYLVMQSILIIGGNVRALPLTGVTLPFASYGGSSLVTSYMALLLLCQISHYQHGSLVSPFEPRPIIDLGRIVLLSLTALALITGWWALIRGPDLLIRTDNPRRAISDLYVPRGMLLDRNGTPIAFTEGEIGSLYREYNYDSAGSLFGYSHPIYGQAGIEARLDSILRGLEYQDPVSLWLNHLIYGQPPPGLDIRLSLDLKLQFQAEELLARQNGAIVILNPENGQIYALASYPNFNPNQLAENWEELIQDDSAPLINRATQGMYQPGTALAPFIYASILQVNLLPAKPEDLSHTVNGNIVGCALSPTDPARWVDVISSGCPGPSAQLGLLLGSQALIDLFSSLGFYGSPSIRLPVAPSSEAPYLIAIPEAAAIGQGDLTVSPLQMALAVATLSNQGILPAPNLLLAIDLEESSGETQPSLSSPRQTFSITVANRTAKNLITPRMFYWESLGAAVNGPNQIVTWYFGGTIYGQTETPLVVVVLLENDNPTLAKSIGTALIRGFILP